MNILIVWNLIFPSKTISLTYQSLTREQKFGEDFRVAANFECTLCLLNCKKMNETKHEICDESFYDSKVFRDFLP